MTVPALRALTRKALAARAKKHQIAGWRQMTKDELVAALALSMRRPRRGARGQHRARNGTGQPGPRPNGAVDTDHRLKVVCRSLGGGHLNGRRLLKPSTEAIAPTDVCDLLVAEAHDP